jgi:6-pyruvoyltetrahydropterin/6-carboxytetrahydropterin synthase
MQVTVEGKLVDEGSSEGMLIDFSDLKKAIEECVMKRFDHAVIFSTAHYRNEAEEDLLCWAEKNNMHRLILNERSTAESMSVQIRDEIKNYLYYELKLYNISEVHIKLWETPTSFAEV